MPVGYSGTPLPRKLVGFEALARWRLPDGRVLLALEARTSPSARSKACAGGIGTIRVLLRLPVTRSVCPKGRTSPVSPVASLTRRPQP